jgi:formate dehydrogenase iron-sulfur subunit
MTTRAAILTDVTKCIGCEECVMACKKTNHQTADVPRRWDAGDGLTSRNWTSIVSGPIVSGPAQSHVRKQCRHCLEPACASACPVGAMHKTAIGAVVYDAAKCMGCRYCMMACPYGVPRYEWDAAVPYVRKCILCYERISNGQQPACTEICPTKATIFGDRDALLAEAHRRIAEKPDLYLTKVWGETEAHGSSVLYVSNVDLSFLTDGHAIASDPLPEKTAAAMGAVPYTFCGVLAIMGSVNWAIGRRIKLQKENSDGQSPEI